MKWGLSWGNRLFRIGQSPNGRWWGYINILGFRLFRYFDVQKNGKNTSNSQHHNQSRKDKNSSTNYDLKDQNNHLLENLD